MLDKRTIFEIHRLNNIGMKQMQIAKELRIGRDTVIKYLKNPEKSFYSRAPRGSKLDPFKTDIDKYLNDAPHLKATVILPRLQQKGFDGEITILRNHLRKIRGDHTKKEIYFNKVKNELFKCMVKGISYENIITTLFYKNNNEYNLALNKEEREFIIKTGKKGNHKLWRYCVALDMKAVGFSKHSIMHILDISTSTLDRIWREFQLKRIDGVQKRRNSQNSKKNKRAKLKTERIIEIIHQNPSFFGLNRSCWTRLSIAKVYEKEYHEQISDSTIGKRLKDSGYSLKKAKRSLTSSDPEYREKVDRLLKVLHTLTPDDMFYFIDEVGPLRVKKYGGRSYTKKGEYKKVPQNQYPKGSIIFSAALSATTNQISWAYGNSKDTSSMIDLLEILYNQNYEKQTIYITWDAASWHSSNELIEWLNSFNYETKRIGDGPVIIFVPLPNNAQFLNIIESVFSSMKKAVIHNSNYQSEGEMKSAISLHFKERNDFFIKNPKRAGNKIWEIDFFKDYENIRSGDYREW